MTKKPRRTNVLMPGSRPRPIVGRCYRSTHSDGGYRATDTYYRIDAQPDVDRYKVTTFNPLATSRALTTRQGMLWESLRARALVEVTGDDIPDELWTAGPRPKRQPENDQRQRMDALRALIRKAGGVGYFKIGYFNIRFREPPPASSLDAIREAAKGLVRLNEVQLKEAVAPTPERPPASPPVVPLQPPTKPESTASANRSTLRLKRDPELQHDLTEARRRTGLSNDAEVVRLALRMLATRAA